MLRLRVITALIMAGLFLALLAAPVAYTISGLGLLVVVSAWEWAGLAGRSQSQRLLYAGLLALPLVVIVAQAVVAGSFQPPWLARWLDAAGVLWAIIFLWVMSYPRSVPLWHKNWVVSLLGYAVLLSAFVGLVYLCYLPRGEWVILYMIAMVASADIGAYFTGKALGKHKLAVQISPGKTWEGFFGGLAAVALLAAIVQSASGLFALTVMQLVLVSLFCGAVSVVGDLTLSMLKRQAGVKDSSNLLPGHGGFLDRFDSIIATAPIFALGVMALGAA